MAARQVDGRSVPAPNSYRRLGVFRSPVLEEFLTRLGDERVKVSEDTSSPWIEVDVFGRYGWNQFAIWKATDAIYKRDKKGAAGDDPLAMTVAIRMAKK